jgi:hypothetical protein
MLLLALSALASATASPEATTPVVPDRHARAAVRIVRPATLRIAEIEQRAPKLLRDTQLRAPDGTLQPARLLEFE